MIARVSGAAPDRAGGPAGITWRLRRL